MTARNACVVAPAPAAAKAASASLRPRASGLFALIGALAALAPFALSAAEPGEALSVVPRPSAPAVPTSGPEVVSLDEALRRAFAGNPSVEVAVSEIRRAEALVREARGPAFPQLSLNATGTELDHDRKLAANTVSPKTSINANANLALPLLAPQRWVGWAHALENRDVSQISLKDVRRTVGLAVARAYLAIVSQHRMVDVNARAVRTATAHYDYAHGRRLGGLGRRLDEVRAEQEAAATASALEASLFNLVRTQEALGVLAGGASALDAQTDLRLPEAPGSVDQGIAEAKSKRTDLQLSQARQLAARNAARDSYADYLPILTGQFQPFLQDPATLTVPKTGWQALLIFGWTLYDGGARDGLRQEREALSAEASTAVAAALRQAQSEVRTAFEELKRADLAFDSSRRASALANEALELATEAYKLGATTNLEVIDAERAARDAQTQAAIAEDAARQARLDLLAASGRFP